MPHTIKQLGQLAPVNTTAASIYSPPATTEVVVHNIIICNTTGVDTTYRLFVDDDGTTYDATTALAFDAVCLANDTVIFEVKLTMNNVLGNIAVRTGIANALTFTVNGEEFS